MSTGSFADDALAEVARLRQEVARLTAERDAARDLAFRAAFAPEEGGGVQWSAVETVNGSRVLCWGEAEARESALCAGMPGVVFAERRVVGPWKPA